MTDELTSEPKPGAADRQTRALTIVPNNELVVAQKKVEKAVARTRKAQWVRGTLLGVSILAGVGGLVAVFVAPPLFLPLILGSVSLNGLDSLTKIFTDNRVVSATRELKQIEQKRFARLQDSAISSIEKMDISELTLGRELRLDVPGESPKLLFIEKTGTVIENGQPQPFASVSLYEANALAVSADLKCPQNCRFCR